jgi:hypothetical protein
MGKGAQSGRGLTSEWIGRACARRSFAGSLGSESEAGSGGGCYL